LRNGGKDSKFRRKCRVPIYAVKNAEKYGKVRFAAVWFSKGCSIATSVILGLVMAAFIDRSGAFVAKNLSPAP
jgi:hypothetical protein